MKLLKFCLAKNETMKVISTIMTKWNVKKRNYKHYKKNYLQNLLAVIFQNRKRVKKSGGQIFLKSLFRQKWRGLFSWMSISVLPVTANSPVISVSCSFVFRDWKICRRIDWQLALHLSRQNGHLWLDSGTCVQYFVTKAKRLGSHILTGFIYIGNESSNVQYSALSYSEVLIDPIQEGGTSVFYVSHIERGWFCVVSLHPGLIVTTQV